MRTPYLVGTFDSALSVPRKFIYGEPFLVDLCQAQVTQGRARGLSETHWKGEFALCCLPRRRQMLGCSLPLCSPKGGLIYRPDKVTEQKSLVGQKFLAGS